MIHVDISNVWGELSLQDLLGIEQEIFTAHGSLPEWEPCREIERIRAAADTIRQHSRACVVLDASLGAQAVIQLLQGPNRNHSETGPEIYFAGNSLSTRQWNQLKELLEGKDFSLVVVSRGEMARECAAALRGLKWIMERKYGTDECRRRVFAVTDSKESTLGQMADAQGWDIFFAECASPLSPDGLLPLAVAGIDISALLDAAARARREYDLRSFENPVWLYAAVRKLMGRCGKHREFVVTWEPGLCCFGQWWQQLFLECGNSPIPATLGFPADRRKATGDSFFETLLRFAPDDRSHIIGYDVCDLDGLNRFADSTLDCLEEQDYFDTLDANESSGVPFLTMECGSVNAETAGELLAFLELAQALSLAESGSSPPESD